MSSRHGLCVLSKRGPGALLLVMLCALVVPVSAFAQASRTFVSGVGDDANPCSRTAPCKTWAGAISKTAAGGEIDALDPGGYGAVTITKSITIDGGGGQVASVLTAGTDGISVQAGSTDRVVLRNLRFQGLAGNGGSLANAGLNGVNFKSGYMLRLENVTISGFGRNGVLDDPSGNSILAITNSSITDNFGDGVLVAPPSGANARALLDGVETDGNVCGLTVTTLGTGGGTCGIGTTATGHSATVTAYKSSMDINQQDGVLTSGTSSKTWLSQNLINANDVGIATSSSGANISLCGNFIGGNFTSDGTPTSSVTANCS